jgi:L-lactate permease
MTASHDIEPGVSPSGAARRRSFLRRGPCEAVAIAIIAAGVFMLMQPFSLALYGYSFPTILAGTVLFMIVSKFPE